MKRITFAQAFTLLSIIAHVKGGGCFLGPRRTSSKKCCRPSTKCGLRAEPQIQPLKILKITFKQIARLMCLRTVKTEGTRRFAALPSARRDFFFTSTSSASSSTKFMNSSNPWSRISSNHESKRVGASDTCRKQTGLHNKQGQHNYHDHMAVARPIHRSSQIIISSLTIIRPSRRIAVCSYSHTWMRDFCGGEEA
jgi:hypothetical protein